MSIKKFREKRNMTQEQLAYKSELSVKTISRLENNIDCATIKSLKKISRALSIEIGEIIKEVE